MIYSRLRVERFLRRQGAVVGRPDVVEALLRAGNMVLVLPGRLRRLSGSNTFHISTCL